MSNKEIFLNNDEIINSIETLMNLSVDTKITAQRIQQLCAFSTTDMAQHLYYESKKEWEIAQGYHWNMENNFYKSIEGKLI